MEQPGTPERFVELFDQQFEDALYVLHNSPANAGAARWALSKLDGTLTARLFPKSSARRVALFFGKIRRSTGPSDEWNRAQLFEGLALVRTMELRAMLPRGVYQSYRDRLTAHFSLPSK